MANLRDVLAFLCKNYPHKRELSKARLTKMVYLADWRASIALGRQLTPIEWKFNHYGPYVTDVVELARKDSIFEVFGDETVYGSPKEVIKLAEEDAPVVLPPEEEAILEHVVATTSPLTWEDFIKLVYSTYPIRTQPRGSILDLPELAHDYVRRGAVRASGGDSKVGVAGREHHVLPNADGGWDVEATRSHHRTQAEAIEHAREILGRSGGGEIVIHARDGHVRDRDDVPANEDPPATRMRVRWGRGRDRSVS